MAGALDRHPAAVRQRARERRGVLVGEDVARGAAHDERPTGDAGFAAPCILEAGSHGARVAMQPSHVGLANPSAVRQTPQISSQAPTEQTTVAERVEERGLLDELLDRIDLGRVVKEVGDALRTCLADARTGVDQHEAGQPIRVARRVDERVQRAHRLADESEPLEAEPIDEALEVGEMRLGSVMQLRRPFAVAVSALVQCETVIIGSQRETDEIPGMRGQAAAVQEDDRRAVRGAPVEVVEAHAADDDVVVLGEAELRHVHAGDLGRQSVVREVVENGFLHRHRSLA